MASLVGLSGRFGQIARCQLKAPVITSCRSAGYWNKDWRPGPTPQTEEEMRAAAKKYKMLYEDYKVRAESEGLTWGDYPKIPTVTSASRDPEEDYDFPTMKRNYGEPINIYADAYTPERLDLKRHQVPIRKQLATFLGVVFGLWYLMTFFDRPGLAFKYSPDMIPEEMPHDGVVHYTFEPAE
uniref:NADH dehydrogenase (Ubiquinone) 1 beta subcomplex subunit 8 n=1 Tax=Rhipicephalus appendiculatus TaxID=34631 RepID=A0A131Z5P9_RHIAP